MFEKDVIQAKGFRNVVEDGATVGFQVVIRTPYYRGIWTSLLEGVEITVDGEPYGSDRIRWTIAGRTYGTRELTGATDLRWPFEELATLTVDRKGGLEPGLHDVQVAVTWRWSYIPAEMQPATATAARTLALVDGDADDMLKLGVSLYSYGADFLVTMTLEDLLADVAGMGATGIEILADTHVPSYPNPPAEWVDHWHGLLERYGLTPTCYSSWVDSRLRRDRTLTVDESLAILRRDLELAHRLGFRVVRPKLGVTSLDLVPDPAWRETVERALDDAERYDVRIAPEIHAPTPLRSQIVEDYLSLVKDTGTDRFGLLIDAGIFQTAPRGHDHSDAHFVFGNPDPETQARVVREMSTPLGVDPRELAEVMPHVVHVHAKFWDMTDDLTDPHIPWDAIVPVLTAGGYQGYLSSEYEGRRDLFRASDMVRRQQAMLRRLAAEHATPAPATTA
jgi:sugar phosphate isomerase/epimerase